VFGRDRNASTRFQHGRLRACLDKLHVNTFELHAMRIRGAAQMDDPRMFPQQYGEPFPPDFRAVVRTVFKRLFRVYAHLYHSHFRHVCSLGEEAHLNTCFKHFAYFTQARARGAAARAPTVRGQLQRAVCALQHPVWAVRRGAEPCVQPGWALCCGAFLGGQPWHCTACSPIPVRKHVRQGCAASAWHSMGRPRAPCIARPKAAVRRRQAFDLIDAKELAPLQELIDQMAP